MPPNLQAVDMMKAGEASLLLVIIDGD